MGGNAATGLARHRGTEPVSGAPAPPPRDAVAEQLALLPDGWTVLADVRRPGSERVCMDYVVVGPGGVFVLGVEPWAGPAEQRTETRPALGRRHRAATRAVADSAAAVAAVLPGLGVKLVRPVLCLDTTHPVSTVHSGVLVCSAGNLVQLLTSRLPALTEHGAGQIATQLARHESPVPGRPRRGPFGVDTLLRRGARAAVAVGALALVVGTALNLDAITARVGAALSLKTGTLGDAFSVPRTDAHPSVRVTVHRFEDVQPRRAGLEPRRLVGVRLSLHNTGERALELDVHEAVLLRPELGRSWTAEPVRPALEGRKHVLGTVRVPPHRTTIGWVVFAVTDEARFDQVSVRFGPEVDDVARWTIP